jgi:hypothetical protein
MSDFPRELLDRLKQNRVRRYQITEALGIKRGVRAILCREAGRLDPPHLVERRDTGRPHMVSYHLRQVGAGEQPGQLLELKDA